MNKIFLTVLSLVVSVTAFGGEVFNCKQVLPFSEYDMLRSRYTVSILETKDITEEVKRIKSVDRAAEVDVYLGREMENGTQFSEIKRFHTVSTTEDVSYSIGSAKKNGFSFHLYLDEYEEAGMTLTHPDGSKEKIRLTCE